VDCNVPISFAMLWIRFFKSCTSCCKVWSPITCQYEHMSHFINFQFILNWWYKENMKINHSWTLESYANIIKISTIFFLSSFIYKGVHFVEK
jgi:hypothetical protein